MSGGLDWPGLLRAGLHGLRLKPAEFWALTPAELALMLGAPKAAPAMGRGAFDALAALYPDKEPAP